MGFFTFKNVAKVISPGGYLLSKALNKAGVDLPDIDVPSIDDVAEFLKSLPLELAKLIALALAPVAGIFIMIGLLLIVGKAIVDGIMSHVLPRVLDRYI